MAGQARRAPESFRRFNPFDEPVLQFHCLRAAQAGGVVDRLPVIRAIDRPVLKEVA